jgi:hypothetical protein
MRPFSISDLSLILNISKAGASQSEVISLLLSEAANLSTIIVISITANYNPSGNFWEGTLLYVDANTTITFY